VKHSRQPAARPGFIRIETSPAGWVEHHSGEHRRRVDSHGRYAGGTGPPTSDDNPPSRIPHHVRGRAGPSPRLRARRGAGACGARGSDVIVLNSPTESHNRALAGPRTRAGLFSVPTSSGRGQAAARRAAWRTVGVRTFSITSRTFLRGVRRPFRGSDSGRPVTRDVRGRTATPGRPYTPFRRPAANQRAWRRLPTRT